MAHINSTDIKSIELRSIGLVEVSSVGIGYLAQDVMLKTASVQLLLARSICSGKYLIAIAGDVASVKSAVEAARTAAGPALIEGRQIARVHASVLHAIANTSDVDPKQLRSLGIIETFSASSIIDAADAAIKSANVQLLRVHLAMALGGKGFALLAGDVSSVQAAVSAGSQAAAEEGMLVSRVVIPAPSPELFREYV